MKIYVEDIEYKTQNIKMGVSCQIATKKCTFHKVH